MPSISTPEMPPRLTLAPAIDTEAIQALGLRDVPLVPRTRAIVIKNRAGAEVALADLKARFMQPCTLTPPAIVPVKIETEEAHAKRVAIVEKPVPEALPEYKAEEMGECHGEDSTREEQKEAELSQESQPESTSSVVNDTTIPSSSVPPCQVPIDPLVPALPSGIMTTDNAPPSASVPTHTEPPLATASQSTSAASNGPSRSPKVPPKTFKPPRKRVAQTRPAMTVSTSSRISEGSDHAPLNTAVSSSSTLVSTEPSTSPISPPTFTPAERPPRLPSSPSHSSVPTQAEIKRRYNQHVQLLTIRQTHQRVMDMHDELQSRHEETMRTFEREKEQMKKLMAISKELLEQAGLLIEREEKNWREEEQEFLTDPLPKHNMPQDSSVEAEAPTVETQVLERLNDLKEKALAEERARKKVEEQGCEVAQLDEGEEEEGEQLESDEGQEVEQPEGNEEEEGEAEQPEEYEEGEGEVEPFEGDEEGEGEAESFEGDEEERVEPHEDSDTPTESENLIKQEPAYTSALAGIRPIQDINSIKYPKGIRKPILKLNRNSKPGKFRYDRGFLLQFKSICVEKPDFLIPLDDYGLGPASYTAAVNREQYGQRGDWMYMGSMTPHYTDWAYGPDVSGYQQPGFQQPGFSTDLWAAYNNPWAGWPAGYPGGGFVPSKKKFTNSYYRAY